MKTIRSEYFLSTTKLFTTHFVDQVNSCLQDKDETQLDEGDKSITVDECLIDIIKGNQRVIETVVIKSFRNEHYRETRTCQSGSVPWERPQALSGNNSQMWQTTTQSKESVDELHTHYKEQMDTIQEEAKKQIKDIEGKYMDAFEERMTDVKSHYETEREQLAAKFNELREMLNGEREEATKLRRQVKSLQQ